MKNKTKAVLYTLICVALWALIPVVSKLGQASLDNHQFLFWSSAVSFIAFLVATVAIGQSKMFLSYKIRDWLNTAFLGFLGTYLYYILLYFGYANAQGLEVLVLQYSWPIFIVLLSIFILKEKLTLKRTLALFFGFVGVVLVLTKGNFAQIHLDNYFVDILVLIAALTFGLFSVLSKKVHFEPYTMITIYFLTATVASFVSMLWLSNFSLPTKDALVPIFVNGLLVNGFSYIFWIKALKQAEASFVAPFVFLTPVLAALYLIIFFREPLLPVYGLGLLAVIIGGLLNKEKSFDFETTSVNGQIYNVELLESFAEQIEVIEVPLEKLQEAVGEGHYYWEDRKGNKLGPSQILSNWETAQKNEDWADHVATIKRADLSNPIWISPDGIVFNGMHRLTRAFLDRESTIKVRQFLELPPEAIVKDENKKNNTIKIMKIFKSTPAWIMSITWLMGGLLGVGIVYGAYKECVLKFELMECWVPMFLFFLPGYPWWVFMYTDSSGYYISLVFAFLGAIINSIIVFLIVRAIHALITYTIEKFRNATSSHESRTFKKEVIMNKITPNLWFKGNAQEAVNFYLSIFPEGKIHTITYYPTEGLLDFQKPFAGKVLTINFELFGQQFIAINAGDEFTFNEAISFNISCKDQEEIDYYWDKLTKNGGMESVCGWCKDKYGLSWQVNPENIEELILTPGAWEKLLQMKKIIIEGLQ